MPESVLASNLLRRLRIAFVAAFVAVHVSLLVATQTTHDPAASATLVGTALRYYEALTGADNTFSFFAPHVAGQAYSQVIEAGPSGQRRVTTYARATTEGDLRVIAFSLGMQQQGLFDLLGYSFAANAFRHSDATEVTVRLGYYKIPKLTEPGAEPMPEVIYTGKYVREVSGT